MGAGQGGKNDLPPGVRPGALSALLQEIAAGPQPAQGGAWEAALRPGASFGKFELVRELGRGSFGVVWEAKDRELGRSVAFKAVRAEGISGLREERLLREAEAAARLSHPNIVTLFDVGRAEQGPYLVLELLRGQTLAERLTNGTLPVAEAVRIAAEIAKGLAHAHGQGVVHRDLKPENVFLCEDGQVKVLDFGLAHAFGQRRADGGTTGHMAPEQAEGAPEDERTDVFALGVVLFEMLVAKRPFPDEKALRSPGAAPALDVPGEPALGELVSRMLEKRPVARPRDGSEVSKALRAFQGELERAPSAGSSPVTTRPKVGLPGLLSEVRRRRVVPAMIGYGTFALLALRGVDWLSQTGRLPAWALTLALLLLGLGFPLSLFLAWSYDLTGQGVRRTPPVGTGGGSGATSGGPRRVRRAALLAGIALLAAVPGAVYYAFFREGAAAHRPVPGVDGRIVVGVADFANETGDPELDDLSGLLITSLEQSRKLRVLTRGRMVDLLRHAGKLEVQRIGEELALEVGRKGGVRALLLASVRRIGDTYLVEVRALDPQRDEYLFTLKDQAASKKRVLALVDRISEQARQRLGETAADVKASEVSVAVAVTPNLEAYRHYFEALRLEDQYRWREAHAELRQALREDPEFTLAHLRLAVPAAPVSEPMTPGEEAAHLREAEARLDRLPARDQQVVKAELAFKRGRLEEAKALYQLALDLRPDDKHALLRLARIRSYSSRMDAGLELAEWALGLDPSWPPAQDFVAMSLVYRGDLQQALALARGWSERWPSAFTYMLFNAVLLFRGELEAALAQARRVLELSPDLGQIALARTLLQLGDVEGAEALARRAWTGGSRQGFMSLPFVVTYRGKRREALALAGELERDGLQRSALEVRAMLAAGDGDLGRLRALAVEAGGAEGSWMSVGLVLGGSAEGAMSPREGVGWDQEFTADWRNMVRDLAPAVRARQSGDLPGARRLLEDLRAQVAPALRPVVAFPLGETCHFSGDDTCAIEALAAFQRQHWFLSDVSWAYPRSLYLMARSQERLGRLPQARATIERLLALWRDADHDLPLLAEARAVCERVGCKAR